MWCLHGYVSLTTPQDRRIAHMPYHALTHAERETYNARRKLLAHIGGILRTKAVDQERRRLQEESQAGRRSRSIYTVDSSLHTGASLTSKSNKKVCVVVAEVGRFSLTVNSSIHTGASLTSKSNRCVLVAEVGRFSLTVNSSIHTGASLTSKSCISC